MNIQVVLFDGFDMFDALAPYEILNYASNISGGKIKVKLVTEENHDLVVSGIDGLMLRAQGKISFE